MYLWQLFNSSWSSESGHTVDLIEPSYLVSSVVVRNHILPFTFFMACSVSADSTLPGSLLK